MHKNLLDNVEQPTATSRDFAPFVVKWSVIWAIASYIAVVGIPYLRLLIVGKTHRMTDAYGNPSLGYLLFTLFFTLLSILYYTTLRQATNTLNYDFIKNWKILLLLTFVIPFGGAFLFRLSGEILQFIYYPNQTEHRSTYSMVEFLFIPLQCIIIGFFTSILFSPILFFFYKNFKKQRISNEQNIQ